MSDPYIYDEPDKDYREIRYDHEVQQCLRQHITAPSFAWLAVALGACFANHRCDVLFHDDVPVEYIPIPTEWYEAERYEERELARVYTMIVMVPGSIDHNFYLEMSREQYEKMQLIFAPQEDYMSFRVIEQVIPGLAGAIRIETIDEILAEL